MDSTDTQSSERASGYAVYDRRVGVALVSGLSVAYTEARVAGHGFLVILLALLVGLVAGVMTWASFNRVGDVLIKLISTPSRPVPPLRAQWPLMLLYTAIIPGIMGAIVFASWLVRWCIHRVA